jgi:2-keto-4-pentenoate hydratase
MVLTWFLSNLNVSSDILRAGQIITTGLCGRPTPIQPGDESIADLAESGHLKISTIS